MSAVQLDIASLSKYFKLAELSGYLADSFIFFGFVIDLLTSVVVAICNFNIHSLVFIFVAFIFVMSSGMLSKCLFFEALLSWKLLSCKNGHFNYLTQRRQPTINGEYKRSVLTKGSVF